MDMRSVVGSAMLAVGLMGCAADAAVPEGSESALIGGVEVRSPELDAVGVLLMEDPATGAQLPGCTATLISPLHVLTAKHCVIARPASTTDDGRDRYFIDLLTVYFAVGNDARAPLRRFKVASAKVAELATGGYGSDVAIYTLEEPATGISPIPVARTPLGTADIGERFHTVGYGVRDAAGSLGLRTLGTVTLSLVDGKPYQAAFGTYEEFAQHMRSLRDRDEAELRALWEQPLLSGYEAYFAPREGDAQPCSGDSGGPLLRKVDGELRTFGVGSWVPEKSRTSYLCARGAIYATFGPSAMALLDDPGPSDVSRTARSLASSSEAEAAAQDLEPRAPRSGRP